MAKTEELAKQSSALERPSYIPESQDGLDQVGFKDIILPRLAICQTNSKARNKASDKYIKGLEEGQIYNTLTGEIYGESIQLVPLFFYHSRIMFKDMDQGGGIICQAPDGKSCQLNNGGPCLHAAWGNDGKPPECMELFNYPCLVYKGEGRVKSKELVIASLKTTGLNAGRMLNSMMRMRGTASYAGIYKLSTFPDKNKAGLDYFAWKAANGEPAWVDTDLLAYGKSQFEIVKEGLSKGTITVDDSDAAFADRDTEV